MSTRELFLYVSPFVLLALIISVTSDYCQPARLQNLQASSFQQENYNFNLSCYVSSFNPEAPEFNSQPFSQTTTTTTSSLASTALPGTISTTTS